MSVCPHCAAVAITAAAVAIPFIPSVLRNLKGKLYRQTAMVKNFGILYGKPKESDDGQ